MNRLLIGREFDKSYLTSPPTPLRHGERSKKLNFSLLLPFRFGEGGWEGEVHRTHVNRSFESLDEVEEILIQRCRQIIDQPDFVHGLTNFDWWSEIAA